MNEDQSMDPMHYEEEADSSSRVSSIYYEHPDADTSKSETEEVYDYTTSQQDGYDYTSPVLPVDYEVPDGVCESDGGPETPERYYNAPPSHPPPTLPGGENDQYTHNDKGRKMYTRLTHTHTPSIYSTPTHSIADFRTNTAASESALDIVNLESNSSTPVPTDKTKDPRSLSCSSALCSRAKVAIFVFLLVAVVIGMVSLAVSVIAVLATNDSGDGSNSIDSSTDSSSVSSDTTLSMEVENMIAALQLEIQRVQSTVDQVMNQTTDAFMNVSISLNVSSLYESCHTDTQRNRCNPESGLGEEFSCATESLPYEREVSRNMLSVCKL